MIIRTVHNRDNPYFMLNRAAVDDPRLSYKAVGLHAYLMSKPDHWVISEVDLARRHEDGTAAVRSGLKELRDAGYIETIYTRDDKGRIINKEAAVYEVPIHNVENPQNGEIHNVGKPQNGKPTLKKIADIVSNDLLESNEGSETPLPTAVTGEYRNYRQQQAAEHVKAAKEYGLVAEEFRALTDAYLLACGTMATANADTELGERELRKAKDAALTGLAAGILEPCDVEKRVEAFRADWGDDKTPYYSQIVNQQLGKPKAQPAAIVADDDEDGIFS